MLTTGRCLILSVFYDLFVHVSRLASYCLWRLGDVRFGKNRLCRCFCFDLYHLLVSVATPRHLLYDVTLIWISSFVCSNASAWKHTLTECCRRCVIFQKNFWKRRNSTRFGGIGKAKTAEKKASETTVTYHYTPTTARLLSALQLHVPKRRDPFARETPFSSFIWRISIVLFDVSCVRFPYQN